MSMEFRNAEALREVQQTIDEFEKLSNMSSAEMLACERHDERLTHLDGFELMDWHYALEQRKALNFVAGSIHAVSSPNRGGFPYARTSHQVLENSPEPELQLVA